MAFSIYHWLQIIKLKRRWRHLYVALGDEEMPSFIIECIHESVEWYKLSYPHLKDEEIVLYEYKVLFVPYKMPVVCTTKCEFHPFMTYRPITKEKTVKRKMLIR